VYKVYNYTLRCNHNCPQNLTRHNKRRRMDKKRPRAGDVDIVPAGDVATAPTATITANQQQQQQQQPSPSPTPADVEPSSPPAPSSPTLTFRQATQDDAKGARPKSRIINWLQCDTCRQWLHNVCATMTLSDL